MVKKSTTKKKHEIVLFTSQIEYLCMNISKEKFIEYRDVGMSADDYYDFTNSEDYCDAIYDELTTLTVDDVEVTEFTSFMDAAYAEFLKQQSSEASTKTPEKPSELTYAVAGERWIKRSWYKVTIKEEFDISKLDVSFYRNKHFGGSHRDTFALTYDEKDVELHESYDSNADTEYLVTSGGEKTDFIVIEI